MPPITTRLLPLFLALTCSILLAADDRAPKTYPIKIVRVYKPGDAFNIHYLYELSATTVVTAESKPPTTTTQSQIVDLTGRLDVLEVSNDGEEQKSFSLTIDKFTAGPPEAESLPPGSVIEITRTVDSVQFKLRGNARLSNTSQNALTQLFHKINPGIYNDDDILGSKIPRKVGDVWEINKDAAFKTIAAALKANHNEVEGKVTFKEVTTVKNIDFEKILSTINLKSTEITSPDPNDKVDLFSTTVEGTFLLPVDPVLLAQDISTITDAHILSTNAKTHVTTDSSAHIHRVTITTPIKK